MKKTVFYILILFIFSACAPFFYVETDKVTQSRFVKCEMLLSNNDFREPSYSQKVTVVKETKRDGETVFTWYDIITLPAENFDIDTEKMYLIVDDGIFSLKNTYEKQRDDRTVSEKKEDILKSDSTKVSVVTGYDVVKKNIYQMTHPVSPEVMNRIQDAKEVTLRYTVGPNFINSEINGYNLQNLKRLVAE